MNTRTLVAVVLLMLAPLLCTAQRQEILLDSGWQFHKGETADVWEDVSVPHDWAIRGPFDRANDLQTVAITQNGETVASEKTARSGGLPWAGAAVYRRTLDLPEGKHAVLLFDGAMSEARVFLNGRELSFWPYGYNSFETDLCPAAKAGANELEVRLHNREQSSRWYPGAGLYRNVHLILTGDTYVPVWGTYITTPEVSEDAATLSVRTEICGPAEGVSLRTLVFGPEGRQLAASELCELLPQASCTVERTPDGGMEPAHPRQVAEQSLVLPSPKLWSPEEPNLYKAVTVLKRGSEEIDRYETVFGVRTISISAEGGFRLNGQRRQFKGVCLHHDLGPLGSAVNESAIRHQLALLKDMGCDAIRTAHNMPAPELVRLCNEMGFMMIIEPFDEWDVAKCENGYHRFFTEWAEKDMEGMLRHYRNDPSVVMWSIGNEVPSQDSPDGMDTARFLQEICHRLDPGRPVTCGMDQVWTVNRNGFAAVLDVPGYNYRTFMFLEGMRMLPQGFILGSETASCVSSRGVYHFPAEKAFSKLADDGQCSSYDLEAAAWSNIPDVDFALADDYPWYLGQFVWTGFDYLGEPHPYDTDAWPSHSSYFGIIDLASLPKDRFYLYRSVWNKTLPTLHLLPHWTWPGREGQITPVFVYTSYPSAELFVNGKSQGLRSKRTVYEKTDGAQDAPVEERYRLMWKDVVYEPGEICVLAYDSTGTEVARKTVCTAGRARRLVIEPSLGYAGAALSRGSQKAGRQQAAPMPVLQADCKDLLYLTVSVTDKDGNPVPDAACPVRVKLKGKAAVFRAVANGDPRCLEPFHEPRMHLFGGKLTLIVQSAGRPGKATVLVKAKGLKKTKIKLQII